MKLEPFLMTLPPTSSFQDFKRIVALSYPELRSYEEDIKSHDEDEDTHYSKEEARGGSR